MANTKERVVDAAGTARPYVDRALHDEELRENLRAAFAAAKDIYNDLNPPRGATGLAARVATDEEIRQNLRKTVAELRAAADRLQQKKESHLLRNVLLLLAGVVIGLFFNPYTGPDTRRWVKDKVSGGSGDEFAYPDSSDNSGLTSSPA